MKLWSTARNIISQDTIDDCLFSASDNFRHGTINWFFESCRADPMAKGEIGA